VNKLSINLIIGSALVLIGVLSLLDNLRIIYVDGQIVASLLFLGVGLVFFYQFAQKKSTGYLIAASIFTFIGLVTYLETIPGFDDGYFGVIFLWGIAALFAYGFLRDHAKWGFMIPAGIFFTLGCIAWFDMIRFVDDDILGSFFFLGLGLTFGFLYLIRNENNKLDWAKVPALGLIAFSVFIYFVTSDSVVVDLLLPLTLIAIGGYLVYAATKSRTPVREANA